MKIDTHAFLSCNTLEEIAELFHKEGFKCTDYEKIDKILLDPSLKGWTLQCYIPSVGFEVTSSVLLLCEGSNGYQIGGSLSQLQKAYDTFEATVTNYVVSELEKIEILEGKEND